MNNTAARPQFIKLLAVFPFIIILSLSAGCSNSETPTVEKRGYIYLGLVAPMTGPLSPMGEHLIKGAQIAVDLVNEAGGVKNRPVKLTLEDEADLDIPDHQRLARDPRTSVLIGHLLEQRFEPVRTLYQQAGIPVILPVLSGDNVSFSNGNTFFRLSASDQDQTAALAEYSRQELKPNRACVVHENSEHGRSLAQAFQKSFERNLDLLVMPDSSAGLKELTDKIKTIGPEAVFLAVTGPQAVSLAKALHEQDLKPILMGTRDLALTDVLWFMNKFSPRTLISLSYQAREPTEKMILFTDKFQAKHHQSPNWVAIAGFDAVGLALSAVEAAGDDPSAVRAYLTSLDSPRKAYQGAAGGYYFKEGGQGIGPIYITELNSELLNRAP